MSESVLPLEPNNTLVALCKGLTNETAYLVEHSKVPHAQFLGRQGLVYVSGTLINHITT